MSSAFSCFSFYFSLISLTIKLTRDTIYIAKCNPTQKYIFYAKGEVDMEFITGVIGFIFGIVVSWSFSKVLFKNGNFQINDTDPDKDVYTLFVDDFNKVHRRRYLLLRITRK